MTPFKVKPHPHFRINFISKQTRINKLETDKERNVIYQIAFENGYNKNTVNKIENKSNIK